MYFPLYTNLNLASHASLRSSILVCSTCLDNVTNFGCDNQICVCIHREGEDLVLSTSGLWEMGGVKVTPAPQMDMLPASIPLQLAR